jgi:tetratricopeptide (TPR) repeat protein
MKKSITLALFLFGMLVAQAQLPLPPSGDNQKSVVSQMIGLVTVSVTYSSPDVHGPNGEDRKGKIWGEVVHYGFIDQGFGTSKAAPWRAGANENTLITFSHDVNLNGTVVAAGTYSLFIDVQKEGQWTWIINKDVNSWGSYFYDAKKDVVRVKAIPEEAAYTEWLTYGFENRKRNTATLYLQWENKKVALPINVPNTNDLYITAIENTLQGTTTGFAHESYVQAAQFCMQNNVQLEKGLQWIEYGLTDPFVGQENFDALAVKAQLLSALKRESEADAVMSKAIVHPTASIQNVHQYGRSLLAAGKNEKALEVFKLNAKNHPEDKFTVNVGLARGYTAIGDKKNAIKHWELAIKNLPEAQKQNLSFYEGELKKLKG